MPDADSADEGFKYPYVPFTTFLNFLKRLSDGPIPPRIDKGFLDNMSGSTQAMMLAALRAFDLVSEDGTVQRALTELVATPQAQKDGMAALIQEHYGPQLGLAAENATSLQLEQSFGTQLTGSTKRKAIQFFLLACSYADIEVSPHFKPPRQPRNGSKKRTTSMPKESETNPAEPETQGAGKSVRTLNLTSGGEIRLYVSVDVLSLSRDDRDFVFRLADMMSDYGEAAPKTATDDEVVMN